MRDMIKRRLKAFTLIELLVVISIIGILTTLIFANLNSARERARDVQRKSDLRSIQTALKLYNIDNGSYPATITFNSSWVVGDIEYMALVPNDPLYDSVSGEPFYKYTYDAVNDIYTLDACLENVADNKCSSTNGRCAAETCLFSVVP